jgi:hypothetical protein
MVAVDTWPKVSAGKMARITSIAANAAEMDLVIEDACPFCTPSLSGCFEPYIQTASRTPGLSANW